MKNLYKTLVATTLMSTTCFAFAADPLANTTWQTFDEGTPKAIVKFTESNGTLTGKIIATNRPEGKRHIGKTIISGLKATGNNKYSEGSIFDPEKNKTYKLTATLNGATLNLKGHLGPFSRSQTWKKN